MPRLQIPLLPPHHTQHRILTEAERFNVVVLGRQSGKTELGKRLAVTKAIQQLPVGWFAPEYKHLIQTWDEVLTAVRAITVRSNQQERRIELVGGGLIEFWSLKDDDSAGRSRHYARAIFDEAALARNLEEVWTRAIRPTLSYYAGDAWFLSTPRGMNYFHTLYQQAEDGLPGWRAWRMPTACNPFISAAEIEAARLQMPERAFAQEYLAEFLGDGGGVFRNVDALAKHKPLSEPEPGHHYVMGVDLARRIDYTVCVVLDISVKPVRMVYMDRFNQIDWATQITRIRALVNRFQVEQVIVDQTGVGDPVVELLRRALSSASALAG